VVSGQSDGDEGGDGGSASPVGATTAVTTSGGASCTAPTVRPPALIFGPDEGLWIQGLELSRTGTGMVLARTGPGMAEWTDAIAHKPWDIWGAWPPAPGPVRETAAASWSTPPAVSSSVSPSFAISFVDFPGCVQWLGTGLDPSTAYAGPNDYPAAEVVGQGCLRWPLAVGGYFGGTYAVATLVKDPEPEYGGLHVETATFGTDGSVVYDTPGCGWLPGTADIASLNDNFVIAASNSTPSLVCEDPVGDISYLVVGELGSGNAATTISAQYDNIAEVRLLPRPGGLWLIYRESGTSQSVTPGAVAVALDESLVQVLPPFLVTGEGLSRFAVAEHPGGGFIIASDESAPSGAIDLRLFDQGGELTLHSSIPSPTGYNFLSPAPFSVVASPDGTSATVSFVDNEYRGYVARADCMTSPAT
jgi:hypothetical protein